MRLSDSANVLDNDIYSADSHCHIKTDLVDATLLLVLRIG